MEAGYLLPEGLIRWFGDGDGGEEDELLKLLVSKFYGQATKGTRWMPWHFEAKKDVASCEKPR